MSLYSFFPMRKRKLCKTPNGPTRRSTSTLGKLGKSSDLAPSAGENGIEILWDNNSPSPTTTIALGKRRRRQNTTRAEETAVTDVSFVVQKFSENTSPVVDHGHSALLEMWINKEDQKKNGYVCDEEFTSPPFRQTRHKKTTSPLSTPLIQRRTSKRQSRKATRQFMLEIRKLVDEIQKSDLSGSSQSQKEIQCKIAEDRAQVKRAKTNDKPAKKITPVTQSLTNGHQPCNTKLTSTTVPGTSISGPSTTISGPGTSISELLLHDSFEWTEDDMDELILTCQLSSSGKGSLTVPDPPRPQCGSSPSQVIFVPETQLTEMPSHTTRTETQMQPTQMLFNEEKSELNTNEVLTALNTNHDAEHAQEVPEQKDLDKWEFNFDEDDSLLASAAQEFELSQEAMGAKPKCSPKKQGIGGKQFNKVPTTKTNSKSLLEKGNSAKMISSTKGTVNVSSGNMATPRAKTKLTLRRTTPKAATSFENPARANENHYPRNNVRTQLRANQGSSSPLQSIPGNLSYPGKPSRLQTNLEISKEACSKQTTAKNYSSVDNIVKERKPNFINSNVKESASKERKSSLLQNSEDQNSSVKQNNKDQENELDFLLCEDNFAALLDDFNFDDVLTEAITQAPTKTTTANNYTKPCTNNSAPKLTTISQKKYSKDEIERKRLEAQRRRLAKAKQKNSTQFSNARISKRCKL